MKICGGIDLHSTNSLIALLNWDGELISQKRLDNNLQGIVEHLAPYQDSIEGLVVESTYNWYWLVDGLMDAGYKVHLANTAAIQQYSGLKYTDDPYDVRWLAELLRLGILPEGYICPKEERAARDLMRKRSQLVHHKVTQMLRGIQGSGMRYCIIMGHQSAVTHARPDSFLLEEKPGWRKGGPGSWRSSRQASGSIETGRPWYDVADAIIQCHQAAAFLKPLKEGAFWKRFGTPTPGARSRGKEPGNSYSRSYFVVCINGIDQFLEPPRPENNDINDDETGRWNRADTKDR